MGDNVPAQAATASIAAAVTTFVVAWMPLLQAIAVIVSVAAGVCAILVSIKKLRAKDVHRP